MVWINITLLIHDEAAIRFVKATMRRPVHPLNQAYAAPRKELSVHGYMNTCISVLRQMLAVAYTSWHCMVLNKLNQLDVILWKFFIAQRVSNVITFILRSRRLYVGVLFCSGLYWCIGAVRLEWGGIRMQVGALQLNKLNQLDVTLWKFFIAQHVSNVITFILRSWRLYAGVLFCFGVYWCIGAVRLE